MNNFQRRHCINKIAELYAQPRGTSKTKDIDFFGEDVFNKSAILKYLPKSTAHKLLDTITNNAGLDPDIAADVAHGIDRKSVV